MAISVNGFRRCRAGARLVLGSIPFGLDADAARRRRDLRAIGSGNIGATNVLRTGRKDLAAATLVLDALKATARRSLAAAMFQDEPRRSPARRARSSATSIPSGSVPGRQGRGDVSGRLDRRSRGRRRSSSRWSGSRSRR